MASPREDLLRDRAHGGGGYPVAVKFRDYYEVLGVSRTATAEDIKRAYRQLARKHHPDLQPVAERAKAGERFKEINEAYEVLNDPDKRAKYDALGANWKSGADFTPPPGTEWRPADVGEWEDLEGFSDFFTSLFGRPAGRVRRGGGPVTIPGSDLDAELPVTLEELLGGGRRRITLDGRSLEVEIPIGVREGTVLRLAGQGAPGVNGGPPGDLYLHVRLAPHPRYRVAGDDLEAELPLSPWQAVLGAEVRIETPDGPVALTVPPGTQNGRRLRLRGRGLPRAASGRGDLYAVARIVVPERPTEAEREAYEALKRVSSTTTAAPAAHV
jgi:curved DNA-binding protein